jgi:nucleolar protein 58
VFSSNGDMWAVCPSASELAQQLVRCWRHVCMSLTGCPIRLLQVIQLAEYRAQLYEYLKSRMAAIAPNLTVSCGWRANRVAVHQLAGWNCHTSPACAKLWYVAVTVLILCPILTPLDMIAPQVLVGELVGARLIAHAGSLMTLAKYPASTVQILGAEKVRQFLHCCCCCVRRTLEASPHVAVARAQALFRALKTKHETPKYGLIYHASLIGQAAPKNKASWREHSAPVSCKPEPCLANGWLRTGAG